MIHTEWTHPGRFDNVAYEKAAILSGQTMLKYGRGKDSCTMEGCLDIYNHKQSENTHDHFLHQDCFKYTSLPLPLPWLDKNFADCICRAISYNQVIKGIPLQHTLNKNVVGGGLLFDKYAMILTMEMITIIKIIALLLLIIIIIMVIFMIMAIAKLMMPV